MSTSLSLAPTLDEGAPVSDELAAADRAWAERILEVLAAGVLVYDDRGRVHYLNRRGAELLGCTASSAVGRALSEVVPTLRRTTDDVGDGRDRVEFDVVVPGERVRTMGGNVSRGIGPDGPLSVDVCLFQDITRFRTLRDERDRLMQLGTLHSVLPSMLHELRNPLAAIESMVEVMVEEAGGALQADLHTILTEVRQMTLNLQGVGSVSRDLASATYAAIDHAIEEVVRVLVPKAREKGIAIEGHVESMPLLRLDPGVVRAIVFNLTDNAIKACANRGVVRVGARLAPDGALEVVVEDDGCGMSREVLRRCTELFYSTKPRGSGIGLALCHRTVERAGGTLHITSTEGRGTRVVVRVPRS